MADLDLFNIFSANPMFEVTDLEKVSLSETCDIVSRKACYDLIAVPNGDLLLVGTVGIDICDKDGKTFSSIPTEKDACTSVQYYKGKIYILFHSKDHKVKRSIVVFDATTYRETTRWAIADRLHVSKIAVCNDKVYNIDGKKVKIYSLTGESNSESYVKYTGFETPAHMSSCPPDGILIGDLHSGFVCKMDCSTDTVVWKWKVREPRVVYCDQLGNVWTWSTIGKSFSIRSSDGK